MNVCIESKLKPLMAVEPDQHNRSVFERFAPDSAAAETENPVERMKYQLSRQAGRALDGLRKQPVEPVFGIMKQVMGFGQFSMRAIETAAGEWTLVTRAWNVKRLNLLRRMSVIWGGVCSQLFKAQQIEKQQIDSTWDIVSNILCWLTSRAVINITKQRGCKENYETSD